MISAHSTYEKAELRLNSLHLMASPADELVRVAWNLLLRLAFCAVDDSSYLKRYTGGI
jgi:hypothetical protein